MNKVNSIKRIALLMIPVFMIIILNGLAWPQDVYSQVGSPGSDASSYNSISGRDQLQLIFDTDNCTFQVKNRHDGVIWKSYVEASEIQSDKKPNEKWLNNMSSLIIMHYTNYNARNSVPSSDKSVKKTCVEQDGKYIVNMDFTTQKIKMSLYIWIENNALHVEVPGESIEEYGINGIMQIDFLPFFMSAQKFDSGYMFYPDGSGALYYFKSEVLPNANKRYSFNTYSTSIEQLGANDYKETNDEITSALISRITNLSNGNASVPVLGIKKGKSAVVAVVVGGDANSSINVEPCGFAIEVNRLFPSTEYRYAYNDPRPDVASMVTYFEKDYVKYDAHIEYIFLSHEKANYSGMANAYRSILLNEMAVVPHAGQSSGALSLFCGITKSSILLRTFIDSVSFSQASAIMDELGAENMIINLIGSGKNGYNSYNEKYVPAKSLGGKDELISMIEHAKSLGNKVYIEENFVEIKADTKRPGAFTKTYIRDANNILISDKYNNEFMVNPLIVFDIFSTSYIKSISKYDIDGITFSRIGKVIVRDSGRKRVSSLEDCVAKWQELMEYSHNAFGGSAAQGGNSYLISRANWLYDIPMEDTGCTLNDESVPFYQIAIHGLVDYSGQPGNLTYDYTYTKLKWIECGYIPFFELTYGKAEQISETSYNQLYSSSLGLWSETAKSTYSEFRDILKKVQKAFIVKHEKLDEGIVKVTYSNGIEIYLNYNDTEWNSNGVVVPASNYIVIQPGV